MPNDFGPLEDSLLVHDVLDDLVEDISPFLGLALNLGEETSDGGLVRTVRPGSTITITDYAAPFTPYQPGGGGYIAPAYTANDAVTVTLPNTPWATSMALTAAEFRVLTGGPRQGVAYDRLREKVGRMMFHGLKSKMMADFFAIITEANYPNYTVSAEGAFSRATEIDLDTALFGRKLASRANGTAILTPAAYGEWAKDHVGIQTNTGRAQGDRLNTGGVAGSASPLTFWRTAADMPADADRGFVFTKTAAALVSRIPDEPTYEGDPVSLRVVVDPASGLAFLMRLWKNAGTGQIQFDCAIIYTFAVLQGVALERILAEEPA